MNTNDNRKLTIRILSICMFIASVVLYLLIVSNFIANYDSGVMHRYVFVGLSLMYFAAFLIPIGRMNGYIRPIRWKNKVWNTIWNVLYFFGMVVAATLMEEGLWNDNLFAMRKWVFAVNCIIIMVIAFVFVMWIPKIWVAYTVTFVVTLIYGLVNHFVCEFKGCPPMFNDFFAAKTATTVMGSYTYTIDRQIIYGGVLFLIALASMLVIPPTDIRMPKKSRECKIAAWVVRVVVPAVVLIGMCQFDIETRLGLEIFAFKPVTSFYDNGAPATMLLSYQFSKPEKPDGYSDVAAERILSAYEPEETDEAADGSTQKPIIIAIMNESFSDFHVLGDFESDPYLSNWYAEDTYIKRGYVYSSVYGGGTCNSEFEFLTGNSMANGRTGTYPYESYDLANATNIVEYLHDTEGYDTVAFHPYGADNWNRPQVYEEFGFNTFLSQDDMVDPQYLTWTITDASDFQKVEEILDEKETEDQPLFLFNVTMQNHAGYSLEVLSQGTDPIAIEDAYTGYEDIISYLTLIRESDREFAALLENLKQREEPIIVCMFGDHQPALDENFMNAITEQDGENEIAQQQKLQMTPYMIWANFDTGIEQSEENMSINYLGATLMYVAGYHTTYTNYLLDLQRKIPVVNACGYQTSDGQWHSLEEENADLDEYKIVQYYEIFGKKK